MDLEELRRRVTRYVDSLMSDFPDDPSATTPRPERVFLGAVGEAIRGVPIE